VKAAVPEACVSEHGSRNREKSVQVAALEQELVREAEGAFLEATAGKEEAHQLGVR
jgi:hypothetical protein